MNILSSFTSRMETGLFAKRFRVVVVLLSVTALTGAVYAQSDLPDSASTVTLISSTSTSSATDAILPEPCVTKSCLADDVLEQTIQIITNSASTPMKLGGWSPQTRRQAFLMTRPATINRRLRDALLRRSEVFTSICEKIKIFMTRYNDETQEASDYNINDLLEIAILMDKESRKNCLSEVISMLPDTRNADSIIEDAAGFCKSSQWHSVACSRIARHTQHRGS